jgi:hypothetical protein
LFCDKQQKGANFFNISHTCKWFESKRKPILNLCGLFMQNGKGKNVLARRFNTRIEYNAANIKVTNHKGMEN